ncbi:MAG TPA: beta-ketoacyl synthase N-terminal-like domain-containing protein [Candidatus Binatia bacterium]|nr:beta-ketoacyl synthase N-terminal-like domain-containing protein [Candidatus Binatia bacterium]
MSAAVAITGVGAVTSAGGSGEARLGDLPAPIRARAARAERVTQLALAAGAAALAAAGLAVFDGAPRPTLGVVLGTAFGCFLTNAAYQRRLALAGPAGASPRLFAATVSNAAAGELGIACRLGGPTVTLSAGAASGLVALGHAAELVAAGGATAIAAGGMDAVGAALADWARDGGLDPGRPLAEAAAVLVLEPLAEAQRRGATARGAVRGWASGFAPDLAAADAGRGLTAAAARALADAGVAGDAVALVVSCAPPALAEIERRALDAALGSRPRRTLVPKDRLGETLGAGGPLGVLAALDALGSGDVGLVVDICASGHVAALVVGGAEGAR